MEEDFFALVQPRGGDIEFAVDHSELNDPVAAMLPLRETTVSVTSLLDPVAKDVHVGRWKQTEIYPKLSRAILSALKSTPHGLKTITDPNDPNKTGLLADYTIAALDSVIDTMDLTNENNLEFSRIGHTDQPFGPNVLLAILRSVMTNGTSAWMNIHLKGAALGTLCKLLPTFCNRTCSGSTSSHSGGASLTTSTASSG
jgi:hypothetical protein